MAQTFTITTTATDTLKSNDKGHAEAVFVVTNTAARPVRGMARARALDSTKQEWLQITGESERDFAPGATQQFVVTFDAPVAATPTPVSATPAGAAADKYSFRLDVASARNPDEDFTESPVVRVELPLPKPVTAPKPFPKWIIPVIAVVVLLIVGVVVWLILRNRGPQGYQLPDVANASEGDARQRLESGCKEGNGCVVVEVSPIADNAVAKGLAIRTEPPAGTDLKVGSSVTLFISTGAGEQPKATFKLPMVANMTEEQAKQVLNSACEKPPCVQIDVNREVSKVAEGMVIRTEPKEGSEVEIGSSVAMFVSKRPGKVTILNVANQPEDRAKDMLEKSCDPAPCVDLEINRVADNRVPAGIVIRTVPTAGTPVETGSKVAVFVSSGPIPTSTNTEALEAVCYNAVQGRIAWNYEGNKSWSPNNVKNLCRGTTNPSQPAQCFQRVMHGGINYGGGTRWQWENASNLCAGTNDAARTISCFQGMISRRRSWQDAIAACKSR